VTGGTHFDPVSIFVFGYTDVQTTTNANYMKKICTANYYPKEMNWRSYVADHADSMYDLVTGNPTTSIRKGKKREAGQQRELGTSHKKIKANQDIKMITSNTGILTPFFQEKCSGYMRIVSDVIFDMWSIIELTAQSYLER
jgi:hypothetical protein